MTEATAAQTASVSGAGAIILTANAHNSATATVGMLTGGAISVSALSPTATLSGATRASTTDPWRTRRA